VGLQRQRRSAETVGDARREGVTADGSERGNLWCDGLTVWSLGESRKNTRGSSRFTDSDVGRGNFLEPGPSDARSRVRPRHSGELAPGSPLERPDRPSQRQENTKLKLGAGK
jgi:hypothetical protein